MTRDSTAGGRKARTDTLKAAALARSADAEARARRAIILLANRGAPVTLAAVAREGSVSESFLYKHPTLRSEIRARASKSRPRPPAADAASAASLRVKLQVVTGRVRELEEELTQLRRENETLRGEVLELRRRDRRHAPAARRPVRSD